MIGWAAVTGGIGWEAIALFAIIFFWTPPHFWALSLYRSGDYATAGVPMLPVVAGESTTPRNEQDTPLTEGFRPKVTPAGRQFPHRREVVASEGHAVAPARMHHELVLQNHERRFRPGS